ncbi:MAG: hypothetical protein NTW86_12655 [Candidatus Sumerlaeota bacterium]|nr:hypothetical protein [Candidatus Sumerlaeota bacterium]
MTLFPPAARDFLNRFVHSGEGRILAGGVSVMAAALAAVFAVAAGMGRAGQALHVCIGSLIAGRLLGLSEGLRIGMPPALIFPVAICTELALVAVVYPLTVFSAREAARSALARRLCGRGLAAVEGWQGRTKRWGYVAVFGFIWFHPLLGAVLARLLGWSHFMAILVTSIASALTMLAWMGLLHPVVRLFGKNAIWLSIAIVAAVIALAIRRRWERK